MVRVTAIVVSYNSSDDLARCLSSLEGAVDEAIVVDNASLDGSADFVEGAFPWVRLIRNAENRGFGAANNQALDLAVGDVALLLNPDASAEQGAVALLVDGMLRSRAIAAGGRLLNPDGSTQRSTAGRLTLGAVVCEQLGLEKALLFDRYWNTSRLLKLGEGPHVTEQVMGACLLMRRVDGRFLRFDESFFLYCEDTDLCRRLREHGSIVYVPCARFVHALGASSRSDRWRAVAMYNRGKERYFAKYHGVGSSLLVLLVNRFGAFLRLLAWSLVGVFWSPARGHMVLWAKVLAAPPK